MQPLGGSKELLPLGWSPAGQEGKQRLRVISEYLVERMLVAGAERICFVVSAEKADLLRYYAQSAWAARMFFVVQPRAGGLCDAVFRAAPFVDPAEPVLIGLPDTVWHPRTAFRHAPSEQIHLITFPVPNPEEFDAVIPVAGAPGQVLRVEVKQAGEARRRVWGAITAPGGEFLDLAECWNQRERRDQYFGHLLNAWIAAGHRVSCDEAGSGYWDIGTPAGYARALAGRVWEEPETRPAAA
jgi:dTDP-glucose pyrophosphorylase